jgi:hypothetical protein
MSDTRPAIEHIEERGVMELLLHVHPALLSRDEILRELHGLGDIAVQDALTRCEGVGLVHSLGGFFWATRAAIAADELKL